MSLGMPRRRLGAYAMNSFSPVRLSMSSSPSRAARTPVLAALTVLMLAAACGGASDQPKIPLSEASGAASSAPDPRTSLSPAARTAIDSGNAAFRA
ncbi:MAG TPA: hypothetical protein VFZ00_17145, partial [Solirubrobacter sp.]|nr:hypothetical protein [Solirubrobacter sp.]